jgi:phosphoribosyl-ATP pyrophosphohydrolase/phosphoribosyl-AMP cyclohydrolase
MNFLADLDALIAQRKTDLTQGSYTTELFTKGVDMIAQKVVEEAGETIIAAKNSDTVELPKEAADLLYHLMVLLQNNGQSLGDVVAVLKQRHSK